MKRILIILTVLFWAATWLKGQQTFSFEIWNKSGSEPPFDWEQPDNWTSTNKLTEFIGAGIIPSDDAHEGDKAVMLSSIRAFGLNMPSSLVLGDCDIDFVGQKIISEGKGVPLVKKISAVTAWYKYENALNDGAGLMEILITRWHTGSNMRELLLHKNILLTKTTDYKQVTAEVSSIDFQPLSDSLTLIFRSDKQDSPISDTARLLIDDVRVEYSTDTKDIAEEHSVLIYPNPAQNGAAIRIDAQRPVRSAEVYDLAGRLARRVVFSSTHKEMTMPDPGTYIVKILYTEGPATFHKILIK